MTRYLFSYGTLLPGMAPAALAPLVQSLRVVGKASVPGTLYDLGVYPGAVLNQFAGNIEGVVYELPDSSEILSLLDRYEDFDPHQEANSEFVRRETWVRLECGESRKCWIYVYNRDPGLSEPIAGGDYAAFRTRS